MSEAPAERRDGRRGELLANRYRIERLLAKGGMGRVYLATQLPLERQVAVKVLTSRPQNDEFRQRFFLEASTCAKLVHRHIVTVHDYGEADDGELFMAMEYLDGEPLSKVISREIRLSSERTCQIALQICRALRTAHKTGVVHRDLKPGNVMLIRDEDNDGQELCKVLDFGLVKLFTESEEKPVDITRSGTWLGSPRYMSPEQIRCRQIDPRTDVYSLGVIMFNMVAGRPPFVGPNSVEILEQHLRDPVPVIADVVRDVEYAPELEVIIQRCMEKDPLDRYQSMDELIADLKAAHRLITGVSVHTQSRIPILSDVSGSMPAPPDLSMPPTPAQPVDDDATPVPARAAAFVSTTPDLVSHDSIPIDMTEEGSSKRYVAVAVALLIVLFGAFGIVRLLSSEGPKPLEPLAATEIEPVEIVEPANIAKHVEVRLTTTPAGATVRLDGRVLGVTPLSHRLPPGAMGQTKSFVLALDGYESSTLDADVREPNVELHAALTPIRRKPAKASADAVDSEKSAREANRRARKRRARRTRSEPPRPSNEKEPAATDAVAERAAETSPRKLAVEGERRSNVVEERGRSLVVDDDDRRVDEGGVPIVD